jgi:ABC-type transporter Mla subunit MlaD
MSATITCAIAQTLMILWAIRIATRKITMNQAELAQALSDLGAQLVKALDEIKAAIQNAGEVTPEVQAALDNAKAVAQALDDLNPDS